ncbi:Usher syndrome type-1C protein-binding protein 1 isoform X2 [Choloepus didactylus]|uniref:Usher syndrome type-1C protein-binding protein 1 isoform X2 n=1 Tax=Choloepus didactylus TaxID=27675 RepID=UPI0018A02AD0|nr:Usher syndrome type-1C protein-binding protein 1 isoform X2 [Choloepus didactylus]XP_037674100.1 Usher syndrome type-1C protein-binding protein 1 isoform X2 [Choloepus didactylus]
MSARATRPRSRRGRQAPPAELDPVAESSEETEAAMGSFELGPAPTQESRGRSELLGPAAESSGQGLGSRTDKEVEGASSGSLAPAPEGLPEPAKEAHQAREAALWDGEAVPSEPRPPDVFQSLQQALSSLEAAATVWRRRPPKHPEPLEVEGRSGETPGPCGEQEGAGGCRREAARLAEKNAWLQLALGSREDELVRTQASLQAMRAEKEMLQREVQELQDFLPRLESFPPTPHSQAGGSGSGSSSSGADGDPWGTQDPFPLAHPLLRRLRSNSSSQILGPLPTQSLTPEMHILEAQMEQLQGSIEKLKCFNRLLSAVLQGYKGQCEGLSMQLSKREAEATALHLALQYSEDCEKVYGALLTLREADSGAGEEGPLGDLRAAQKEAWRLLGKEEAAMDGEAQQGAWPSPEGSSVDGPVPQEVATQLQAYIRRLQQRRALVKIPPEPGPTLAPLPNVPRVEAMLQSMLGTQPSLALPQLEKTQIQQELAAARETLADLTLKLQMARREKRGLELQEAALRAQGPAHVLLLEQLRWERAQLQAGEAGGSSGESSGAGSSGDEEEWVPGPPTVPGGTSAMDGSQVGRGRPPEELAQELAASLTRARGLREQLRTLWEELQQMAQKERARRAQSAELSSNLCKTHSALVLAFRGTHRKQEEQQRTLEQQMARLQARHAGELAVLGATARALGRPQPPCPLPRLGDTLL